VLREVPQRFVRLCERAITEGLLCQTTSGIQPAATSKTQPPGSC
jgi:hypothetical protein